jgi:hypothetical protein
VLQLRKRFNPRVVLIGDSITHFWDGPAGSQSREWSGSVATSLRASADTEPRIRLGPHAERAVAIAARRTRWAPTKVGDHQHRNQ